MTKERLHEGDEIMVMDESSEEGLNLPVVEDAIVDVAFGDPEDEVEDTDRVLNWVESFPPGVFQKQVADLFMSEGEIYINMEKMTITIPLMEVFRLLEKTDFFKKEERT